VDAAISPSPQRAHENAWSTMCKNIVGEPTNLSGTNSDLEKYNRICQQAAITKIEMNF
jgi:hypothetical protein